MKLIGPPPPRKQNSLFDIGSNIPMNACVGINGGPYNLIDYARGYFRAVERMVESLQEDSMWVDMIIYPLVYNARHATELYLKHLALVLPQVYDEKGSMKPTHKLMPNWMRVKPYLQRGEELGVEEANPFDPEGVLIQRVQKTIEEMEEIDPDGEAFRFPWSRKESRFLQDTSIINVEIFWAAMESLRETFDYWDGQAWPIIDYLRENQRYE